MWTTLALNGVMSAPQLNLITAGYHRPIPRSPIDMRVIYAETERTKSWKINLLLQKLSAINYSVQCLS